MGLTEEDAYASVRFSFGEENSMTDVKEALRRLAPVISDLRLLLAG